MLVVLVVLMYSTTWLAGWAFGGIASLLGYQSQPAPITGSPIPAGTPAGLVGSGASAPSGPAARSDSPTIGSIFNHTMNHQGQLRVAIHESPGLAQLASSGSLRYTGFDIALLEVIAHGLGANPVLTTFKPSPDASSGETLLGTGDADLMIGDYKITALQKLDVSVAGPYLVRSGIEYGIGLPARDPVFQERITEILRQAIKDGTWDRLYRQYFHDTPPAPPEPR
ncbi:MAG TPA: hypothetical protein VFO16_09430 [Pseudonocardiaceae bacterium]|nr:hypothetical protein [Pseudonocardiaceae bacterium]